MIIVPPYEQLVNIDGNVKRPMYYEIKPDETVKVFSIMPADLPVTLTAGWCVCRASRARKTSFTTLTGESSRLIVCRTAIS